jgi:metal-dependent amidase/aminoacylase/carboxypeptidase family protein
VAQGSTLAITTRKKPAAAYAPEALSNGTAAVGRREVRRTLASPGRGRGAGIGAEHVVAEAPTSTGSEDFAFMLERQAGCCLFIGNGAGDEHGACMIHNPGYDFNEEDRSNVPRKVPLSTRR